MGGAGGRHNRGTVKVGALRVRTDATTIDGIAGDRGGSELKGCFLHCRNRDAVVLQGEKGEGLGLLKDTGLPTDGMIFEGEYQGVRESYGATSC